MPVQAAVDLDALAAEARAEYEAIEREAERAAVGAARTILPRRIALGERLNRIREPMEHGQWLPWLKKARIPQRTAWEWMFVAQHKAKLVESTNLTVQAALKILRGHGLISPAGFAPAPPPPDALDAVGLRIPHRLLPVFARLPLWDEAQELAGRLEALLGDLEAGPGGEELAGLGSRGRLLRLTLDLPACRPHAAVCPWCQDTPDADPVPGCEACGGRGWLPSARWEVAPADARARFVQPCPGPPSAG